MLTRPNYLIQSIRAAGLDPAALTQSDGPVMDFAAIKAKAWKDIWGCGQGVAAVNAVVSVAELVERLAQEYASARTRLLVPT